MGFSDRRFCVEVTQNEESRGLAKFLTRENSSGVLSFMRSGYPRGRGLVSHQRSAMHSAPQWTGQIYWLDWTLPLYFLGVKSFLYISSDIYHVSESTAEIFPPHPQCDSCLYHVTCPGVTYPTARGHMLIWTTSLWASSRHNALIFMFETPQCLGPSNTCI